MFRNSQPAAVILLWTVTLLSAQTSPGRIIGSVVAATPAELTIKTDAGENATVKLEPGLTAVRVAAGQTDLSQAAPIPVSEIVAGDRVLVRGKRLVVMPRNEVARKQQADQADWQKRGISGTVTAVSPATSEITVSLRTAEGRRLVAVDANKATFRRYSPGSVRFADARPSSIGELKAGDEIRILGNGSEDGTRVTAEAVVFGTFRNFPATVTQTAGNTLRVTNLQTKQPVAVAITADTQVRRMPDMMARTLAARARGPQVRPRAAAADPDRILERMPAIPVTEIKPGDAIIVAASEAAAGAPLNAVALVAGVEPLFSEEQADPAAAGSWSLDINIIP